MKIKQFQETAKKTKGKRRRKSKQEVQERNVSRDEVKVTATAEQSAENSTLVHDHDYASHSGSSKKSSTGIDPEAGSGAGNEDRDHSYNAASSEQTSPSPIEAYDDSNTNEQPVAFSDKIATLDPIFNSSSSALRECPTLESTSDISTSGETPNLSSTCSTSNNVSDDEILLEYNENGDDKKSNGTDKKNGGRRKGKSGEKKDRRCLNEEVKSGDETKEEGGLYLLNIDESDFAGFILVLLSVIIGI